MSMMDNVLGVGRYGSVNESVEPELQYDDFDSIESLGESVDPMEFILTSIFENEMNMVNIDTAIMCEEYSYLRENGSEMVYEAVSISSIIEKCKAGVLKLWEKIKAFLKKAQEKIITKMDDAFLRKYESKAKGKYGSVKGYEGLFNLDSWKGDAKAQFEIIAGIANDVYQNATDTVNPKFKKYEEFIRDDAGGEDMNRLTIEGMFKDIKKNKKDIKSFSADKAIEVFKNILKSKNEIKKAYEDSKKTVDLQLKALKKMESVAKKFRVLPTETSEKIHEGVKAINKMGSWLAAANRAYMKVMGMAKSQAKAVIVSAAAKDIGTANESSLGVGGFIDSVQIM